MTPRRVGITGIGVLTGYGRGVGKLWEGLSSGRSAVRMHAARLGRKTWLEYPMASLTDDTLTLVSDLPKQQIIKGNRLAEDRDLIALADCVRQALADARLAYDHDNNDVGLVVTHESPGLAAHVQGFFRWGATLRAWLGSTKRFNPPEFLYEQQSTNVYRMHSFLYVHHLSALFDLHGFTLYNNNACSSGAFAMAVAADRIRAGQADAVVVVGGDLPEDGTKFRWFDDLGLYSRRGACRPFSASRDGLVLGSGAAALVLESIDSARARGRGLYAEWLGAGFSSDGWKVTLPDVEGRRYAGAIRRALDASGVTPGDVTLIGPHGVGGGLYDHYEAECLASIFGDAGGPWPPLMPLKGAFGHTLGGCVLVETVAALLALRRGTIPAAAVCSDPDPALPLGRWNGKGLDPSWVLLKCANGFAGQNGAVVLRAPEEADRLAGD
ncbi:MAG TPA: beta-ketoacyl synthase N-terminal-like domain-containing protein [Candidatus Polarisedimenticolia bacterium]|jgi:3-oxoacyl-[acyl-carrier-protein] synthase II